MSKFEKLKDSLGDWYTPLHKRITDDIYEDIYKAASQYSKAVCYPEPKDIFKSFQKTNFKDLKVVILGQDPYHDGNATGLAFECKTHISPSMDSIQDAYQDYYKNHFNTDIIDGTLEQWTGQGILLLNTALTVEKGKPNSHKQYWEKFTEEVIKEINRKEETVIFMLWGAQAQAYEKLIYDLPHHIIKAEHPVAGKYNGRKWLHNDCFSKCNELLLSLNKTQIIW